MNLPDWLAYIEQLHTRAIDFRLEPLQRLASLAQPSLSTFPCPVITIAGTNGKGSVVRFLETIYLAAGYHTAAYTSPHLLRFNERLRIDGQVVSDAVLLDAFTFVEHLRGEQALSFFEFTTLAILYICQQLPLDVLLLEVGLGGRLDAVNLVEPDVAVITAIDIDHTDWLGSDRESIGREKAGIMRSQKPVVVGDPDPPHSLTEAATALAAPLYRMGHEFTVEECLGRWHWQGSERAYRRLPYPMLKLQNAATSLMTVELLQKRVPVTETAIRVGLQAQLSGRFEIWYPNADSTRAQPASIIFDVAHNPQAARYLAEQLAATPIQGRTLAVVGILKDKDIANMLRALLPCVDAWYLGTLPVSRGASAAELSTCLTSLGVQSCDTLESISEALALARFHARSEDRIVVWGSFYTVSFAKQACQKRESVVA